MATDLKPVDVVIVGVGAAGGMAALPLAEAGIEVVGIEAGTWLTPRDFAPDELRLGAYGWPQARTKTNLEVPTHRLNASSPNLPRAAHHPMLNAVGGTNIHFTGCSWRLNPWDFLVVRETTRRYGRGRIPPGSTVEDWPFGYEELEPYYDKVEYALGVSGKAGNVKGTIRPSGNIFEGPRSRDYPMPPLRDTEFSERMAAAARRLGWHPFPLPSAINSRPYDNRSACMCHGYCTSGGCPVDAKNTPAVTTIPRALKTGRFTIVTRARVTSIEVDANGRAAGVMYLLDGQSYFQPAAIVLLASQTYENTRLLLLSKSKAFPNGLANHHGQVGRHYFSHGSWGVAGIYPFRVSAWYGTGSQGVTVDDWADDNFDHSRLDFIGGANIQLGASELKPIAAASMDTFDKAPRWGSQWKAFVKQNASRLVRMSTNLTTLPHEGNYLDLDPIVKDAIGFPVVRITGDYTDNEKKAAAYIQDKMVQWHLEGGAIATHKTLSGPMGPVNHTYGGTRMGDNPETNVVDRYGFAHEVPNLGVLGASVMGTSGAHNPTETLQALAWRTADYLVKNWKARAG